MQPFLTQLAEICRTERTRAKWVIVPTHTLGHTLGERLALAETGWVNLRFTTPLDLALPRPLTAGGEHDPMLRLATQHVLGIVDANIAAA